MKILFLILISLNVWARGNEKGNGGNFLACTKDGKITYTLLDFDENVQIFDSTEVSSWEAAVESKILAIKQYSPLRGDYYMSLFNTFIHEVQYKSGGHFSSSDDVGPISVPNNCELVQVATQFYDTHKRRYEFYVNADIWSKISEFQKAGLVLHEILLTEAVESGHESSKRVRNLNALIWTGELFKKGPDYFHNFLNQQMNFRYVDKSTYWIELFDEEGHERKNEFWPNGQPFRIYTRKGADMCVKDNCWKAAGEVDGKHDLMFDNQGFLISANAESGIIHWQGQTAQVKGQIGFFPSGALRKAQLASPLFWERGNQEIEMKQLVFFYPEGQVETLVFDQTMELELTPFQEKCLIGGTRHAESLSFYPNSVAKDVFVKGPCNFTTNKGSVVTIKERFVHLDERGLIVVNN